MANQVRKGLIVQKFGGTSVRDKESIVRSALLVKEEVQNGAKVVVVVSAMAGVTNSLLGHATQMSNLLQREDMAECDSILCSGEQVSSGLFALALLSMGIKARSWAGWQLPINTTSRHGNSLVEDIHTEGIESEIARDVVSVIAGFQGINDGRETTLGRGGSDISAVALAAALKAERCDIYTDVPGVFSADPRLVPEASLVPIVGYEEMLELSASGAVVLHPRAVSLAMKYGVVVRVISSSNPKEGMTVVEDREVCMERSMIVGISSVKDEVMFSVSSVDSGKILSILGEKGVVVNAIVRNYCGEDVDITVKAVDKGKVSSAIGAYKHKLHEGLAMVSVVGAGMMLNSGVVDIVFSALASAGIDHLGITTSEIKVSVFVDVRDADEAVRRLHAAFDLGAEKRRA